MSDETVSVAATLRADGKTLELDEKLSLPPGRVILTVQSVRASETPKPDVLEVLDRIHRDQKTRGKKPMTEEQMAAEIAAMRADDDEYEEHWRQIWAQSTFAPPNESS
jgi:hypothetical protein